MKPKILFYITFILILSFSKVSFSQDVTQVTFLSELDAKIIATYGDALILFKLQSGGSRHSSKISNIKIESYSLTDYDESTILTKGMASLMTAKYLNLGGSFMYLIFGTERYAYKSCIANGIFSEGGSENDKLTGPELIELLSRISDIKGGE